MSFPILNSLTCLPVSHESESLLKIILHLLECFDFNKHVCEFGRAGSRRGGGKGSQHNFYGKHGYTGINRGRENYKSLPFGNNALRLEK